jgi:hypothetical protein
LDLSVLDPGRHVFGKLPQYSEGASKTPGIRVESRTSPTTSGLQIRNGNQIHITFAARGFENSPRFFHPTINDGKIIGKIIERFPDEDWAIAKISDGSPITTPWYLGVHF